MYTSVHSDVSWESCFFKLFDLPQFRCTLDKKNKPGIYKSCIPVDSFDLRCESVTYGYIHVCIMCACNIIFDSVGELISYNYATSVLQIVLNLVYIHY